MNETNRAGMEAGRSSTGIERRLQESGLSTSLPWETRERLSDDPEGFLETMEGHGGRHAEAAGALRRDFDL